MSPDIGPTPAARPVTRPVTRPGTRPASRPVTPALVLASGLVDRDWIGAQLATAFASDADALDRCEDPAVDCSPHPLFEEAWCGRTLAAYLGDREAMRRLSPHPLVDIDRIVAEHPSAAGHPSGPLSWWVAQAGEDTPVPVPNGFPEVSWGVLRAAALDAAARREQLGDVLRTQRRTRRPPDPTPDPPPLAPP